MADTATATMAPLTVVTFPAEIDMATAGAGGARYLAQHRQPVATGWTAKQPTGNLGQVRPPPSAVKIIADILLDQSGTHDPDL